MSRTASGLRNASTARLAEVAEERPEFLTWIALLEVAWRAIQDDRRPLSLGVKGTPTSTEPAPLLHRQTLVLNQLHLRQLLQELFARLEAEGGPALASYQPTPAETLALIAGAIRQDADALDTLAIARDIDPGSLSSVAHLAALCVMQQCRRQIEAQLPLHWPAGYCPVCGAWPILAERRGLDRSRRLRCGRCATDWEVQWLYCIYCGERDHNRLGSLVPDDSGEQYKVETCASCRGYLKSVASLQRLAPLELLITDLETVELDLVALNRDYHRPLANGFALDLKVTGNASRPGL
jgi:FdhE protein